MTCERNELFAEQKDSLTGMNNEKEKEMGIFLLCRYGIYL